MISSDTDVTFSPVNRTACQTFSERIRPVKNPIPTDCKELLSRQVTLAAQNQELASALEEAVKLIEQLGAEGAGIGDSATSPAQPQNAQ